MPNVTKEKKTRKRKLKDPEGYPIIPISENPQEMDETGAYLIKMEVDYEDVFHTAKEYTPKGYIIGAHNARGRLTIPLKGDWLFKAGFRDEDDINVVVMDGMIVIRKIERKMLPMVQPRPIKRKKKKSSVSEEVE